MRAGSKVSSSSASMAWAKHSTRRSSPSSRKPPAASMRRSAATAISSLIWCGASSRTAPIPPSSRSRPTRACRSRRLCAGRRAASATPTTRETKTSRCRAISTVRNGRTRPASNSANWQVSTRSLPRFVPPRRPRPKPHRSSTASHCPALNARWRRRSTAIPSASCVKATRRSPARRWPPPLQASRRGRQRHARSAPQRSNAPRIGWSKNAAR